MRARLFTAVTLIVLGLLLMYVYQEQHRIRVRGGTPTPVLIAKQDIPIGVPVRREWLTVREVPENYVEERHIPYGSQGDIIGLPLSRAVRAGESVLTTDLSSYSSMQRSLSSSIPEGMRAIAVEVDPRSVFNGLLRPGDRVDLTLNVGETTRPASWQGVMLLENALVLAVGKELNGAQTAAPNSNGNNNSQLARSITLQVSREEAQVLAQIRNRGSVPVMLRNPNDILVARRHDFTIEDILLPERRLALLRRPPHVSAAEPAPTPTPN